MHPLTLTSQSDPHTLGIQVIWPRRFEKWWQHYSVPMYQNHTADNAWLETTGDMVQIIPVVPHVIPISNLILVDKDRKKNSCRN